MCLYGNSSCWLACVGIAILWWVIASVLVFFTWNRVVGELFKKLPKIKWWHPFAVIATVAVLSAPCVMRHRGHAGGYSHHGGKGHCADGKCDHAGHSPATTSAAAGGGCPQHAGKGHANCDGNCKDKANCDGKCDGKDCAKRNCPHHAKAAK